MIQGMRMNCPEGWQDKSMLILSASDAGASGVRANMVVTRDAMPTDLPADPQARMAALLDRQVAQMSDQLAGFAEVSRRVVVGSGRSTAEVKVDWRSGSSALTQSVTFVDAGEDGLMIATATAGRGEFADAEPEFRRMLQSFRIA